LAAEILRPNGVGDYTNLRLYPGTGEANWEDVDEVTPDEFATLVASSVSGSQEKDAYALEATAIPAGSIINSVKVYFRILENAETAFYQPFLRLGSSETAGTEINPAGASVWATYNEALARPGGGSWAVSDLNSLQVVIGLKSVTGDVCTQVYVEVDYTLIVALAGSSGGVASVSGLTLITRGLAGLSSGVASVSGLAVVSYKLAGVTQGAASVSGLAVVSYKLAGVISGVASVSGATAVLRTLAGVVSGLCSVSGQALITRGLAGIAQGVASVSGLTLITRGLAGVSSGVASVTATLGIWKLLAGIIAGVATVTGKLRRFHVWAAVRNLSAVRELDAIRNIPPVRQI
jgi:hypothetical protein